MATWQDRWRDAKGFWNLAERAYDPDSPYGNPAASNAIMAVIAANDAICIHLIRRQPKGESHIEAADLLKQACKGKAWEKEAADKSKQLLELLCQKNEAQYLGKPLSRDRVSKIMKQAERFIDWTATVLPSEKPKAEKASTSSE